jgi:mono/diheme cytochrome c family protein
VKLQSWVPTGLVQHRSIGDLMRYIQLVEGMESADRFGQSGPFGQLNPGKLSDEQLYATSLYVYSLQPPPNPNPVTDQTRRGERVFGTQGCAACHTPPLYTSNALTPAAGFVVPAAHRTLFTIIPRSVNTDSRLAMSSRKGTGYYRVPSLRGVWYRGPFEHNGSVATLEDWFNPARLHEDYVPTGFKGIGVEHRAVKGHEFGLQLSPDDKAALIAFLRTL